MTQIPIIDAANNIQWINSQPPLGQTDSANSLPVVLANNQSTINTNIISFPGLSTSANVIGSVVQAGSWNFYNIGASIEISPTVTAGSYSAGKVIGGIITFNNILSSNKGILKSISLKFKESLQTTEFDVGLFSTSPTGNFIDNTLPSITSQDSLYLQGIYRMIAYQSIFGTHTIYSLNEIGCEFYGGSNSLYAVVVSKENTSANLASITDMSLRICINW